MRLPSYDELPVRPDAPPGSSWGVWGDGDVLGCLNLLTPERAGAGFESVVDGAVFPLGLELELPAPPLVGRSAFRHEVTWFGGQRQAGHDELLHGWNTQTSSHWDGFRHIRHPEHSFYGGVADGQHGVHHWARRGMVGRAVLCDVDGSASATGGRSTTRPPIRSRPRTCAPRSNGRTSSSSPATSCSCTPAGSAGTAAWTRRAARRSRRTGARRVFLHLMALPLLGLPLGELWELGPLVAASRADGRWTCLLVSAPLNLAGGVASPANAVAIR